MYRVFVNNDSCDVSAIYIFTIDGSAMIKLIAFLEDLERL